jgi:hypothetical protein
MESVIIVTPGEYDARFRARIPAKYGMSVREGGVLIVEDGRTRIYIAKNDSVRGELGAAQLEVVAAATEAPTFYAVDFTDLAFCRDILMAVADDPDVLVDNDHGVLLAGSDFVRVLRSQGSWDWRRDLSSTRPPCR